MVHVAHQAKIGPMHSQSVDPLAEGSSAKVTFTCHKMRPGGSKWGINQLFAI